MKVAGIKSESVVDGLGFRMTLFTQGCPHHCKGCHNEATHAYEGGTQMSVGEIMELVDQNPLLDGMTFSGGEPFVFAGELAELATLLHAKKLNVWTYSGYTFEQLSELAEKDKDIKALFEATDVLVDGRFEQELLDLKLVFRGSSNQRVIDMVATRKKGEIVLVDLQN